MTATAQTNNIDFQSMMNYFVDLVADKVAERMINSKPVEQTNNKPERIRLNGIRKIATYLQLSTSTVQKMKNLDKFPVYYTGSKLYTYSDELEQALKN